MHVCVCVLRLPLCVCVCVCVFWQQSTAAHIDLMEQDQEVNAEGRVSATFVSQRHVLLPWGYVS